MNGSAAWASSSVSSAVIFTRSDGRVRPGWCFLLSVVVIIAVNYAAAYITSAFHFQRLDGFEALYRPLLALLEAGGFVVMAQVFDNADDARAEVGFPRMDLGSFVGGAM